MTLSVLEVIPLLQAFSNAIFRICGILRSPPASAELLVNFSSPKNISEMAKAEHFKFCTLVAPMKYYP